MSMDLAAAAARSAADAQARAAEAAKQIRRKRKDAPAGGETSNTTAAQVSAANGNGAAASSAAHHHTNNQAIAAPSAPTFASSLHVVPPTLHSTLQNTILSHIFPASRSHPPHYYRQLPGPQPASILRKDLTTLNAQEYWACEKSDGERAMLFVSKEHQATFLIDRKFLIKQLRHPMYNELWSTTGDTLLDGELVIHESTIVPQGPLASFMTFDVLLLNGTRLMEKRLSERLKNIGMEINAKYKHRFPAFKDFPLVDRNYVASAADGTDHPLAIRAKRFEQKQNLKNIFALIKQHGDEYIYDDGKRKNKNDGIIFTPENDDYMCRAVPLLKWKWPGLNTIDFLVRSPWFDHDSKLMLYSTASQMSEHGSKGDTVTVHIRSTQLTPEKRAFFLSEVVGKQTCIVEMQYDTRTSSWQPKVFRHDKSSPNFMTTVIATLETSMDNVMPNDLCLACGSALPSSTAASSSSSNHHSSSSSSHHSSSSSSSHHPSSNPHQQQRPPPPRSPPNRAAPQDSHLWSSGASSAAAPSKSTAPSPSSVAAPAHNHSTQNHSHTNNSSWSSAVASSSAPSFPTSFPTFSTESLPPISTSKSISAFEQIAAAEQKPLVETTRLFGD